MADETKIESASDGARTSTGGLLLWTIIALIVDIAQIIISSASAPILIVGWIFGYIVTVFLAIAFYGIVFWQLHKKGEHHWIVLGLGLVLEIIPGVNLFFWAGISIAVVLVVDLIKQTVGIAAEAAKGQVKKAAKTLIKKGAKLAIEAIAPEAAPAIEAVSKAAAAASAAKKTISNKPQF